MNYQYGAAAPGDIASCQLPVARCPLPQWLRVVAATQEIVAIA